MREIKFRRVHLNYDGTFHAFTEWGVVEGGFNAPSHIHGCKSSGDEQFTGLKDKHGNEIYEGDIIEYTQHMFNTEKVRTERKAVQCKSDRWNVYETNAGESNIEVIGNIHETPKLLK